MKEMISPYRKNRKRVLAPAVCLCITLGLAGCAKEEEAPPKSVSETVSVGFSQIGAESDWRLASTESMRSAFNVSTGYTLIFDNGQQKQENQLKAMRKFIDSGVDYIVLDPITETGWDATLEEAAQAKIPVIIVDRRVIVEDDEIYAAWAGSDFRLEGDRACGWLAAYLEEIEYEGEVNIAHIQGTLGSSAQIGRSDALFEMADEKGWNILESVDADFVQAKGREVMEEMLSEYGEAINVIYCENDSEALGAIEALKSHNVVPGVHIENGEVLVISFDATRDGLEKTIAGEIAVDTECNPNYGVLAVKLIHSLEAGLPIEHENYQTEEQFSAIRAVNQVTVKEEEYPVTYLTQKIIDGRSY